MRPQISPMFTITPESIPAPRDRGWLHPIRAEPKPGRPTPDSRETAPNVRPQWRVDRQDVRLGNSEDGDIRNHMKCEQLRQRSVAMSPVYFQIRWRAITFAPRQFS